MPSTAFHVIQIFKLILLNPPTSPKKKWLLFFPHWLSRPWVFQSLNSLKWLATEKDCAAQLQPEWSAERNHLQIKIRHPYSAHIWFAKLFLENAAACFIFSIHQQCTLTELWYFFYHFFKLNGQLSVLYTIISPTSPTRNLYGSST